MTVVLVMGSLSCCCLVVLRCPSLIVLGCYGAMMLGLNTQDSLVLLDIIVAVVVRSVKEQLLGSAVKPRWSASKVREWGSSSALSSNTTRAEQQKEWNVERAVLERRRERMVW